MDYSRIVEYRVGLFVVIATGLFLFFVMALGGDKAFFKKHYTVHMLMNESVGLYEGSVVQLAGIQVGNVSRISFDQKSNKLDVSLRIDESYRERIARDSVAGLRTQGALGDKYVSIQPGTFGGEPLNDGDVIETEVGGDLLSTLSRSGDKFEKLFAILDNLEKMTRTLNEKSAARNLSDSFVSLRSSTNNLDEILLSLKEPGARNNKIRKTFDHLASILEKIDKGQGTLGSLINDPTVHEDLKSMLGGAKRSKLLKYLIRQTIQKGEEEETKTR